MASPFPGMDPYIDSSGSWVAFQKHFVANSASHLNQILPRNYAARIEERPQPYRACDRLQLLDTPTEWLIHIQRFPDRQLITGIEVLCPEDKVGSGRTAYLAAQSGYRNRQMNLVELDLLIGGERLPVVNLGNPTPTPDYCACVRTTFTADCFVVGWSVRSHLPTIQIPLSTEEESVSLDLQAVFQHTYDAGRYPMLTDYSDPPPPGLSDADREWAVSLASRAAR